MKHRYIDSLLSEIQSLESKVANLKKSQHVPFSFFKESFKRTQEITRLLHELEFVQIEDMKGQMERLVQFLSEAKDAKEEASAMPTTLIGDSVRPTSQTEEMVTHNTEISSYEEKSVVDELEEVEQEVEDEKPEEAEVLPPNDIQEENTPLTTQASSQTSTQAPTRETATAPTQQSTPSPVRSIMNQHKETIVEHLGVKNKSLNDVQPVNQTIQDAKRTISLNDRFLFQRELFNNNREIMNAMMVNLQPFTSFDAIETYLKDNTNWDFRDETVDKFMQMLKDSFK